MALLSAHDHCLAVVVAATLAFIPVRGAASCMACHEGLKSQARWVHSYREWERSVHRFNEVSCVECHGGDDAEDHAATAHVGLQRADHGPRGAAAIALLRAQACGTCHGDELRAFRQSPHHRALANGKRAADCMTCHGPLGDSSLDPVTVQQTCRGCHAPGAVDDPVAVTCDLLERTRRVRLTVAFPGQGKALAGLDRDRLLNAVLATMAVWHTSDIPTVRRTLSQAAAILACQPGPSGPVAAAQTP